MVAGMDRLGRTARTTTADAMAWRTGGQQKITGQWVAWGEVAMPAYARLSDDDIKMMVQYILSLK